MPTFASYQQHLDIAVCEDASQAIQQGYFYRAPIYKPIQINKVVVVRNGTEQGNATVDLIMEDETGQKYVCLLTHRLLTSIPTRD